MTQSSTSNTADEEDSSPERPGSRYGGTRPPSAQGSQRSDLLRLLATVAAVVLVAALLHGLQVVVIVAALVAMIMVHELGHFVTAKRAGMKVTEYFLGFGPRVWSIRKGETAYGIKAIPAGGYVRILGMTSAEEVDPGDEARTYRQASFPRRMSVAVAGSVMHFVMAYLLLFGLAVLIGLPTSTTLDQVSGVLQLSTGPSPASRAGFRSGDVLVSVDGHKWSDPTGFDDFIGDHPGVPLAIVVRRGSRLVTLHATPADGRKVRVVENGQSVAARPSTTKASQSGFLGVEQVGVPVLQTINPLTAVWRSGALVGTYTRETVGSFASAFSLSGLSSLAHDVATSGKSQSAAQTAQENSTRPVSIVGVVEVASNQSAATVVLLLAVVNIFLGMANMFPMLPLDGGHVLIAVYERIRSRRGRRYIADVSKLMPVAYAMLAFIVVLGLSLLYLDIVRPVHLPGG